MGEWNEELFSDVFSFLSNNTLSRAELSNEGLVKNIHYGDILVKYRDVLSANYDTIPYVSNNIELKNPDYLKNGDIIIADTAEDETVGKATELTDVDNIKIVAGLHTMPCRPNKKFAQGYLGYYINSAAYHNKLFPYMQGIKVTSISKSNISKTVVAFPSFNEQEKLSSFIGKIDKFIALQKQLIDSLKSYKRGALTKLFPQKGENTPQYRFKGFTEPWEQRKLGEMMNVTSVKRIHQSDWTSSGVRFLRARDIVAAYKNEEPSDYLYISQEKYNEYSLLSGRVKTGDLLVTGVGTIGVPMLINDENPLYFKDGNIIWFQNENKINGNFLYYSFIGNATQSYIQESAGTGTVGTYTIDSGKKTPIALPKDMTEQEKIGSFFRSLDNLIALHQRRYDVLLLLKSALLQQMFI